MLIRCGSRTFAQGGSEPSTLKFNKQNRGKRKNGREDSFRGEISLLLLCDWLVIHFFFELQQCARTLLRVSGSGGSPLENFE